MMSSILVFLAYYVFALLLQTVSLNIIARIFRFAKPSFLRSALVIVITFVLGILIAFAAVSYLAVTSHFVFLILIATSVISILVVWLLILWLHHASIGRAWAGVGAWFVAQVLTLMIGLFFVRCFVDAYQIPTLAMAPTLVSDHYIQKCPNCGSELLVELPDPRFARGTAYIPSTCLKCGKETRVPASSLTGPIAPADHILVSKYLTPQRWDVIAYHASNGDIFVKRIVALPNETLAIDSSGTILINGSPVPVPPGQQVKSFPWPKNFAQFNPVLMPSGSAFPDSIHLGPNEYFAIGDNSRRSHDSRFLGPVKSKDIVDVITTIYWPLNRLRILR